MMKFMMIMIMMMIISNKNNKISMLLVTMSFNLSMQTKMIGKTSYVFMGDCISFWITSMTLIVMYTLMFLSTSNSKLYFKIMDTTALVLMMTFYSWNFMMFYITFEMSMILILVIIMSWGYQPERTEAMTFMIVMTLTFSLPLLTTMMVKFKNLNFWYLEMNSQMWVFLTFLLIFMMKMPSYFIHFWLPKAHVEAPVQGSMILAAIMLKLGCYGMIRMEKVAMKFNAVIPHLVGMVTWSSVLLSMKCIMQIDLKTLIAYSSIVHMTTVMTNILMMKTKSMFSSMLIIVGHGLCSSSMFFAANIMYETSKSRSIMLNKGMLMTMPSMALMWFIACMNNAPMPPSMNMLGELMSFKNMINWSEKMYLPLFLVALTSSMYSIYMFYIPSHGKLSKNIKNTKTNTSKALKVLAMQMAPAMLMMVKPNMMVV